jgi:hypothetical protein
MPSHRPKPAAQRAEIDLGSSPLAIANDRNNAASPAMKLLPLIGRAVAVIVLAGSPTYSQTFLTDLGQPVMGQVQLQYLDLVRLAMPGLVQDGADYRTGKPMRLPHISGEQGREEEIVAGTLIGAASVLQVQSEGRKRLAMMLDLGQPAESAEGIALLALYDIESEPRLLDLANVAYDRETSFFHPGKLTTRNGNDTLLVASSHSNSNQTYRTFAMINLHGDRMRVIDTIFTLSDSACGFERSQRPRFTVAGSARRPAIQVSVTETVTPRKADCGREPIPRAGKRTVSVSYEWRQQTGRFVKNSDAFERLAKETSERF